MTDEQKVAVVTGANKGIGYEITKGLARLGYTVGVAARNQQRGADAVARLEAEGLAVFGLTLDVTDDASVAEAAAEVQRRFGRLDALVNNAGVSGGWAQDPSKVTADTIRAAVETNVIGTVRVTNAFLPLLLASPAASIVNISSGGASLTWQSRPEAGGWLSAAYAPSKTMLNAVTVQYAKELADTTVRINAVDPGYTATDFTNNYGDRTPEQGARIAIRMATLDDGPTGGFFSEDGPEPW